MPNKTIADWFDQLESVLQAEAELSGLLSHGSTIGQAREFLVSRVLSTFLPAGVHIGSGKIIDSQGNESKQIDIIIYDPRFPLMKVEGGGLYFVEGVLATIEVKSTINKAELKTSLENCKSVLSLVINGEHPEEAEARITFYMERENITHEQAEQRFWYMFHPATYVFGFSSKLSLQATAQCIADWWGNYGCAHSSYFPLLPRVINSGNIVGFVNDGRIRLNSDNGSVQIMSVFKTPLRFRWFAVHLMDVVSSRLGLRNFAENFQYRISEYVPSDDYVDAIRKEKTKFISRDDHKPSL